MEGCCSHTWHCMAALPAAGGGVVLLALLRRAIGRAVVCVYKEGLLFY